ncbi:MAG: 5'-nucleotidase C-terminal domain-containing protein, partial [Candidatus Gastranaerophilales bacterium]|nr:5'-nucleotidase C-terminal domain-containing protein [Candidatus Gastranaerophilales bacterium]
QGIITDRNIKALFPFKNGVYKVKLTQKDIVDAIKTSGQNSKNPADDKGILQVSGINYKMNKKGELLSLSIKNKNGQFEEVNIQNPDANKTYSAVYNGYLLKGKENMSMLKKSQADILETYNWEHTDAFMEYVKSFKNNPVPMKTDGRIEIV